MSRIERPIKVVWVLLFALAGCAATDVPDEHGAIGQRPPPADSESGYREHPTYAPDDYTLGPGDVVTVHVDDLVQAGETARLSCEVTRRGHIWLPLAGDIAVAKLTAPQARDAVNEAMKRYLRSPKVSLGIEEYRSKQIHIQGAVTRPGQYSMPRNRISLVEALSLASGLAPEAGLNAIIVRATADGAEQLVVDLEGIAVHRAGGETTMVEPGDTIFVREAGKVSLIGCVAKPGAYTLRPKMTALELVVIAGGLLPRRSISAAWLRRRKSDGNFEIRRVDLESIGAGHMSDVILVEDDVLVVPAADGLLERWFPQRSFPKHDDPWDVVRGRMPCPDPDSRTLCD